MQCSWLHLVCSSLSCPLFSCTNNNKVITINILVSPNRLMNSNLLALISLVASLINFIAAIFIAYRLLYFQIYIQTLSSERSSQYTTVIVICVESAALIVLFSILYLVLWCIHSPAKFIIMQSLVHINVRVHNLLPTSCKKTQSLCLFKYQVISPLLIIYRVALGKALTWDSRRSEDGLEAALRFASTRDTTSVLSGVE